MKQKIMEKLFTEQPLTNEEILHIGARLDSPSTVSPYKHTEGSVARACGLKEEDFDAVNSVIRTELGDPKVTAVPSKEIETMEKIALTSPTFLRLIMYNYVQLKNKKGNAAGKISTGPKHMTGAIDADSPEGEAFKRFIEALRQSGMDLPDFPE